MPPRGLVGHELAALKQSSQFCVGSGQDVWRAVRELVVSLV